MAIKDNIDFSTFSDLSTAFDLYSNSIRRAFSYDSYGDKRKFQAVVLTNPIPVTPEDLKFFTGTSHLASLGGLTYHQKSHNMCIGLELLETIHHIAFCQIHVIQLSPVIKPRL